MPSIKTLVYTTFLVIFGLIGLLIVVTIPWLSLNDIRHKQDVERITNCLLLHIGPEICNTHYAGPGGSMECYHSVRMSFNTSICNKVQPFATHVQDVNRHGDSTHYWIVGNTYTCTIDVETCTLASGSEFGVAGRIVLTIFASLMGLLCFIGPLIALTKHCCCCCCCRPPNQTRLQQWYSNDADEEQAVKLIELEGN